MKILADKEQRYGAPSCANWSASACSSVDSKWMDHIDNMDQLKQGMACAATASRTPLWNTASKALPCSTR